MAATRENAIALLNAYWIAPLTAMGYQKTIAEAEIPYWQNQIDALGIEGAIALAMKQPGVYAAAHPLPTVTPAPVNSTHSEGFSLSPGVLVIGALAAYFLLKGK